MCLELPELYYYFSSATSNLFPVSLSVRPISWRTSSPWQSTIPDFLEDTSCCPPSFKQAPAPSPPLCWSRAGARGFQNPLEAPFVMLDPY